jgi:hypothetical protein
MRLIPPDSEKVFIDVSHRAPFLLFMMNTGPALAKRPRSFICRAKVASLAGIDYLSAISLRPVNLIPP